MSFAAVATSLGGFTLLALVMAFGLLALHVTAGGRAILAREVADQERTLLGVALLISAIAMVGSLYFSEVVGFTPCLLCWYQRIAMYPLVLVLGVAVLQADRAVWRYAAPLAGAGLLIAVYHNLLQHRPALDVLTCSADAPCTLRYLAVFGFISIPFMAGAAFLAILALVLTARLAGLNPPARSSRAPRDRAPGTAG